MPYRNAAATLDEAAASILGQRGDGADLELVAIDDGSSDDGPARVAALAAADRRVVRVASGGVGIARALGRGLEVARAPLIARMDADDVSHPDRLSRQRALIASDDRLAIVATQVRIASLPGSDAAAGEGLARYVAWQNRLLTPDDHARELYVESPICHPSVLLRRAALDAVGAWRDFAGPEDYDLWLRLHAAGWRMAKVPAVLFDWRHAPGRATFADPRYAIARFVECKAPHLAQEVGARRRPLVMWGAGPTAKGLARALEPHGVRASAFVDIDPRKIGRQARGVPVIGPAALIRGAQTILVAVGRRGARDEIRARLTTAGFAEGDDFLCAA
jgi:glycosyl transferase family 2